MSNPDLDRLNRLRVNAGMTELKSWKASRATLLEKIEGLVGQGYSDALPGANVKAAATVTPELEGEIKTLEQQAKERGLVTPKPEKKEEEEKPAAKLARGLDTDPYAAQSRLAVRMQREKESKKAKAEKRALKAEKKLKKDKKKNKIKLNPDDKKQIKDEAKDRKIAGKVDEKKDPEKAQRQLDKIAAKQAARAAKPKPEADKDNFTVAELARELDIDPKTARNKLRRHEDKITKLHSKGQDRWTFPNAAKKELTKILRGEK